MTAPTAATNANADALATVAMLRRVDYLGPLDDDILGEIAGRSRRIRFASGECVFSELESGAEVFVILAGEVEASIESRDGARQVLCTFAAGSAFGEMASLTGELRSATVTAITELEVLVISDSDFDSLRQRRPSVGIAMVRLLAKRLGDAEHSIDTLLAMGDEAIARPSVVVEKAAGRAGTTVQRGSLARIWRELVVNHKRDLAFITLAAFVVTLLVVRGAVHLSFRFDLAPREVLRAAYMTGFGLLTASACASLLRSRAGWRRLIALAYGIGVALIFNELGVTLAFDIFYKDIHTADPNAPFNVERLYQRTEAVRAIVIALAVLVQAAYLRTFYRRAYFIAKTRLRKLTASSPRR